MTLLHLAQPGWKPWDGDPQLIDVIVERIGGPFAWVSYGPALVEPNGFTRPLSSPD